MSNPQTVQIFTAKATNGVGVIVKTMERAVIGNSDKELVTIQVAGTWEGVTVKPQISLDGGSTFSNAIKFKEDGSQVDVSITDSGAFDLEVSSLAQFTLIVSGVGGTPPDLDAWAVGNIAEGM